MTIVYLINHAGKGGSEKYVLNMVEYAISQGDRAHLVYNEPGPLAERAEALGMPLLQMDMASPLDWKAAKKLAAYCTANQVDIIHTQFARENYVAVLSKKCFGNQARIIHTCHIHTENNFFWRMMNKALAGDNDTVIAVCRSVKDKLVENNYPAESIRVVYNGVAYREALHPSGYAAKAFGLPEDCFIFISLARFSQEKGIFFMLEAVERLAKKIKGFSLIIAGDGPLYEEAKNYVKNHGMEGQVVLPGHRSDGGNLLESAGCFVNASSSEALSFAILEAMEAGLPVIATNTGGNPEIINERTACGRLVDYGDSSGLAAAMEFMVNNPEARLKMAENSRYAIKEIFNVDNSIKTTYNIYLESKKQRRGSL